MNKLQLTLITLLATGAAHAQVVFSGDTDTVYKATTDNANVALVNNLGAITLTNNSGSAKDAQIFGNFANTALAVGESITISFTLNSIPQNGLNISLSGSRQNLLINSDTAYDSFSRSFAGFRAFQPTGNINVETFAWQNGPRTNTAGFDRNILTGATQTSVDRDQGGIGGSLKTGTGDDRMEVGRSADIAYTLIRASETQWQAQYEINVGGGTGPQTLSGALFTPTGDYFLATDSFTSFAIGYQAFADGNTLDISNLTITAVPEPATYALIAGVLALGLILLRRRRAASE